MLKLRGIKLVLVFSCCVLGCNDSRPLDCLDALANNEPLAQQSSALVAPNAMSFNAMSFNAMTFNAMTFNGMTFNGTEENAAFLQSVSLNGMLLQGQALAAIGDQATEMDEGGFCLARFGLEETSFSANLPNGDVLAGTNFIGAEFMGLISDGRSVRLRIDDARRLPAPNDDLLSYSVSALTASGYQPLCGLDDDGLAIGAIPIKGTWDYREGMPGAGSHIEDANVFTFACRGYALAKCVEFGYKPWQSVEGVSLGVMHEACVRMVRADYCGDGRSWTQTGTLINLYDSLSIQVDEADWLPEAEWGLQGARCMRPDNFRYEKPDCYESLVTQSCGTPVDFQGGTLLVTEFQGN